MTRIPRQFPHLGITWQSDSVNIYIVIFIHPPGQTDRHNVLNLYVVHPFVSELANTIV